MVQWPGFAEMTNATEDNFMTVPSTEAALSHISNISTLADIEQQVTEDRRKYSSNSNHSMINPYINPHRRAISTIALNHSNAGSLSTSSGTDSFKGAGRFYHIDFKLL